MKTSPLFYFILLLIWMGGSTWYYVCKIKHHCDGTVSVENIDVNNDKTDSPEYSVINDSSSGTSEMTKEDILKDVKSKIENGYIVFNFPKNSAKNENIEESFDEFAQNLLLFLNENPNEKIEIIGHTDDDGSTEANIRFGKKRAIFISKKLITIGIDKNQIIIKSKGKEEPVASNDTEEGREKNRRVVIKLIQN